MNQAVKVTPHGILLTAQRTLEERGQQRDQPGGERSMPSIVRIYQAITGKAMSEHDGYMFMVSLKLARMQSGEPDLDHYVDGAAYFALAGEAALAPADPAPCPICKGAGYYHELGTDRCITCDCGATPDYIGASMYSMPPAAEDCADTIDATAMRWNELQALLRERAAHGHDRRPCTACNGSGNAAIDPSNHVKCPVCAGVGDRAWTACGACSGTGVTVAPYPDRSHTTDCPNCRGRGEVPLSNEAGSA